MIKKNIILRIVGLLIGSSTDGWAAIHQPHMITALDYLSNAKMELESGEHNKGGHCFKALEFVERAIEQTIKGIETVELRK